MIKPWIYPKACVCLAIFRLGPFSKYLNGFYFFVVIVILFHFFLKIVFTLALYSYRSYLSQLWEKFGPILSLDFPASPAKDVLVDQCLRVCWWMVLSSVFSSPLPLFHSCSWIVVIIYRSSLLGISPWGQHFFFIFEISGITQWCTFNKLSKYWWN